MYRRMEVEAWPSTLCWDTFALCYIKLYFNIVSGNSYSPSIGFDIRAKIRLK